MKIKYSSKQNRYSSNILIINTKNSFFILYFVTTTFPCFHTPTLPYRHSRGTHMKHSYYPFSLLLALFLSVLANAQSPTICPINAGPNQSICTPNCANLSGTFVPTYATTNYTPSLITYAPDPYNAGTAISLGDDQWSAAVSIGFNFCFYGQVHSQCLIGANGLISFDLTPALGYCQWPISAAVPTTSDPMNTIMGPWQDLYPPGGGTIKYAVYGAAPCRRFVVSWYQVPMYSCTTTLCTQQLVLYETTNIIDNFIQTKLEIPS